MKGWLPLMKNGSRFTKEGKGGVEASGDSWHKLEFFGDY
jgi:hypothetical protein